MKTTTKITGLLVALIWLIATPALAAKPADTVAINGKIYTMNEKKPWAEAVAIRGTDIVYVGDNKGVKAFIGKNTTVGDLKGKMMLPGFIDTHMHMLPMCVFSSAAVISHSTDKKKMLAELKAYVDANPDGPYFSFGGAFSGAVDITKEEIDAIIKDKPFVMISQGGHGGWANTLALKMVGIEKGKPDPVDVWNRYDDGEPTGGVGSSPAIWAMVRKLDLIQKEGILKTADKVLIRAPQNGITTSFEAATFRGTGQRVFEAVAELEKTNRLPVRIIAGPMIQRDYDVEGALAELKKFGPMYSSDMFDVNYLKVHGDGSPDNRTAKMLLPYKEPDKDAGFTALTPEEMKKVLLTATGWGYNVHTHTIGDGAVTWALDAFEAVRKAGHTKVRLNTGHTFFVDPADYKRFKELNVGVDTMIAQIPFNNSIPVITDEQRKRFFPVKTLLDLGVRVSLSADYPVLDMNPFRNMYLAITRTDPDDPKNTDAITPNEKIDLKTALKLYTVNPAYMVGKEDKLGSIEVGKKADLIVIDRNLFDIPIEELPKVNVLATMLGGRVVHEEAVDWEPPKDWWRGVDIYGHEHGKNAKH